MASQEVYNQLQGLFNNLEKQQCLSDLTDLISYLGLENELLNFSIKYPSYNLTIQKPDIEFLIKNGILDSTFKIQWDKFICTPLEKLLIALLWKNGDINKIQHIVDGILQTEGHRTDHSLIFKQFGNSLANINEPIVDQHVLRAFEIYSLKDYSEEKVNKLRKKSVYKTSDKVILDSYRLWFKELLERIPLVEQTEFKYKLDKVLFIKGKSVKL